MIEPKRAIVRPRVICERATDAVLLEDLVEDLVDSGDVDEIELHGRRGSGTTTALQHVAYAFAKTQNLQFDDQRRPAGTFEHIASGAIVLPPSSSRKRRRLFKCRLADWGRDEWIEYLLATKKSQCASVMKRLQNEQTIGLLDGNPNIVGQVLDELSANDELYDIQAILSRIIDRQFSNIDARQAIALRVFWLALGGHQEERAPIKDELEGLTVEQSRLLSVPGVILKLALEAAWHNLEQRVPASRLFKKWPRGLIDAVAARVATTPKMQDKLQSWIDSKQKKNATVGRLAVARRQDSVGMASNELLSTPGRISESRRRDLGWCRLYNVAAL